MFIILLKNEKLISEVYVISIMWFVKAPNSKYEAFHIRCNDSSYRVFYYSNCESNCEVKHVVTLDDFESLTNRCTFMDCSVEYKQVILLLEENSKKKELDESLRMDSLVVAKWLRSTDIEDIPNKFLNKILSKGRCF